VRACSQPARSSAASPASICVRRCMVERDTGARRSGAAVNEMHMIYLGFGMSGRAHAALAPAPHSSPTHDHLTMMERSCGPLQMRARRRSSAASSRPGRKLAAATPARWGVRSRSHATARRTTLPLPRTLSCATQFDDTVLHKAAYKGHTATVCELVRLGADVNAKNKVRRVAMPSSRARPTTVCVLSPTAVWPDRAHARC
jgi:hypothetical protein